MFWIFVITLGTPQNNAHHMASSPVLSSPLTRTLLDIRSQDNNKGEWYRCIIFFVNGIGGDVQERSKDIELS